VSAKKVRLGDFSVIDFRNEGRPELSSTKFLNAFFYRDEIQPKKAYIRPNGKKVSARAYKPAITACTIAWQFEFEFRRCNRVHVQPVISALKKKTGRVQTLTNTHNTKSTQATNTIHPTQASDLTTECSVPRNMKRKLPAESESIPWNLPNPFTGQYNYCWLNALIHCLGKFFVRLAATCPLFLKHPIAELHQFLNSTSPNSSPILAGATIKRLHRRCLALLSVMNHIDQALVGKPMDFIEQIYYLVDPAKLQAGGWCSLPSRVLSNVVVSQMACSKCRRPSEPDNELPLSPEFLLGVPSSSAQNENRQPEV
jgi:hypothetical protein